jgi:hypothetical protein
MNFQHPHISSNPVCIYSPLAWRWCRLRWCRLILTYYDVAAKVIEVASEVTSGAISGLLDTGGELVSRVSEITGGC